MIKLTRGSKVVAVLLLLAGLGLAGGLVLKLRGSRPAPAIASSDSTSAAADKAEESSKDGEDDKEAPIPVPVEIEISAERDIPSYFRATGSLEATRQVELISKAGGQIVRLRVEEGDHIKRGAVALELEHREEDLLFEQASVRAAAATRELARIEGLVKKGLGSDKDLEASREAAEIASLEKDLARVRRDNKIVRAPFSGQVTARMVELGQTVGVGQSLVSLADVSPLEVRLFLPEKIVRDLQPRQPVEIRSDVNPEAVLTGTVERISPAVDPATSTVKVTLSVAHAEGVARVGSFVRARITTDVHQKALTVSKRALVPEAGVTYLFVASADSVHKVAVTTGYSDDEFIEITEGIEIGSRVICVGQGGLRQGSKIRDLALAVESDIAVEENAGSDESR